jgi:hypothetical protein
LPHPDYLEGHPAVRRRILASVAAVAVALTLAVAPAPAFANNGEDGVYVPKSKWKGYMLNVTGSILGAAMPQSWQREQMAYKYSQNGMPSAEQLNAMYGHRDMVRNVDGQLIPRVAGHGTYDDVVLRELDDQLEGRSTRKKIKVPATAPKNFIKNVAGLGSVVLGLPMAFQFGSGVAALFGLDSEGAVCQGTPENGEPITQFFTGVDCEAWKLDAEYQANADAASGYTTTLPGHTITLVGSSADVRTDAYGNQTHYSYCWRSVPALPAGAFSSFNSGGKNFSIHGKIATGPGTYAWMTNNALVWSTYGGGSSAFYCAASTGMTGYTSGMINQSGNKALLPELRFKDTATGEYIEGAPITADPDRTMTCTITYTDGSTDSLTSDPYKESSGSVSPLGCPPPDENKTVAGVAVTEAGSGTTHQLLNEPTTQPYKDFQEDYPECHTGVCMLDLLYKKQDGTSYGSCFDLEDGCPGWFEDPTKTDKYECMYGVKKVDLDECAVYAGLFAAGRVETGTPYSDPLTGIWSGGKNAPEPSKGAMAQTVQNPTAARTCNFAGLGFDPVGWVLRPIQCAFEWAFIPRPAVVELHNEQLDLKWQGSMPGKYAAAVAGVGTSFTNLGAGNCSGIQISMPVPNPSGGITHQPQALLNSCPGSPFQPASQAVFWILSGVVVLGGVWGLRRMLDRFVGF